MQNSLKIPIADDLTDFTYDINEPIGEGAFGKVYCAKHNQNGGLYALKVLKLPPNHPKIPKEVKIHYQLNHPNIVNCVDFI